jgi:hypothetical protein
MDEFRGNQTPNSEPSGRCPSRFEAVIEPDESQQEEYRREYHLQMQRLACPGCGEEPLA